MASFTNNSTINTTITLSDISESAYTKILDFIRSVVDRENGIKPEKKTAPKPEQKPAVQKEDPARCGRGESIYPRTRLSRRRGKIHGLS